MAPDGSVYSTSDLGSVPHRHPNLSDFMNYYARYGMRLTYLGWTEDVAGYPVITNAGLAAQGTITPQEDELSDVHVERIINEVNAANEAKHLETRKVVGAAQTSINFNTQKNIEAVGRVTQQLILDTKSPAEIVAIIPEQVAAEVVKLLTERLAK
jgi:hypothetical protein